MCEFKIAVALLDKAKLFLAKVAVTVEWSGANELFGNAKLAFTAALIDASTSSSS